MFSLNISSIYIMQCRHGRKDLHEFLDKANTFHKTVTFTREISNENHVFLDTVSRIEGSQLVTDLYSKPTCSHQYLLPTSCHPRHCCKNTPWIRRICSQEADYERRPNELSSHLCRRGYKSKTCGPGPCKSKQHTQTRTHKYKTKLTQSRIYFVVTYHQDLPNIQNIIDKHWQLITTNSKLNRIFLINQW